MSGTENGGRSEVVGLATMVIGTLPNYSDRYLGADPVGVTADRAGYLGG